MSDKAQKTVRIKWVRSGIGFTHHQKRIVRSLGLRKLNQEVERPDTPQIRGIVAKVPHLLKIVEAPRTPAWKLVPEYTILAPAAEPAKPVEAAAESPAIEAGKIAAPTPAESEASGGSRSAPPADDTADSVADPAAAKSGIERHAEIAGSAEEESKPADPGEEA